MKILTIDPGGLHVDTARKFGFEGHDSYYYCPWHSAYTKFEAVAPGVNCSKITKVMDWAPYVDKVDLIVFPDVGLGETADWLRNKGYTVFGAGLGEKMEQDRKYSCEQMEKMGMKYPKSHFATGLDGAIAKVKELMGSKNETNQLKGGKLFAKFDIIRGTVNSFPIGSVKEAEEMFNAKRGSLGPFSETVPICLQESVEGIETGADLFFNGEDFVRPYMWGFENGEDYVGVITNHMESFEEDLKKAAKYLKSVNYRGALSFESIYDGKDHHWLDWTCRFPMPLGLMYTIFNDKLGDTFYKIAKGEPVTSGLPEGHYLGCAGISSEEVLTDYTALEGNPHTRFVRFMANSKGDKYGIPGSGVSIVGIFGAKAKDLKNLREEIVKNSEGVSAYFGKYSTKFVDEIEEKYVKPLEKMGVHFKPEEMRTSESLAGNILKSLRKHGH